MKVLALLTILYLGVEVLTIDNEYVPCKDTVTCTFDAK